MADEPSTNCSRPSASSQSTPFRASERYWKSRASTPDLSHALCASSLSFASDDSAAWVVSHATSPPPQRIRRLSPGVLSFDSFPGLVLLPDFLAPSVQRDLVKEALREAAVSPPNSTSLDPHYTLPAEGIWEAARREPRREISRRVDGVEPAGETAESVLRRLRWATVGDIYDWTRKIYLYNRPTPPIPPLIAQVCLDVVRRVDWRGIFGDQSGEWDDWHATYRPEAGLVNFYHPKDTLTAHVDQAEVDATSPLVSISIGLPAVFLVGGATKDKPPLPLLVRSGDVLIMAGPSRQAYHGVPRVLDGPLPGSMALPAADDPAWHAHGFARYMQTTRVNLNVRQVRP